MADIRIQRVNEVPRPPDPVRSFPGDPGEGRILMGHSATAGRNTEFTRMDAILGATYGIARVFDQGSGTIDWTKIDYHRARGRMVAYSVKNNGAGVSNDDLAAMNATARAWIDSMSSGIAARSSMPFALQIHHEPDNDITTSAAAEVFRAAKRQAYHRLKVTNGLTNLAVMDATWMGGGSFGDTTRDWRWWSVDWKGTSTGGSTPANPNPVDFYTGPYVSLTEGSACDVLAFDGYNFWGVEGHSGARWRSNREILVDVIGTLRKVYGTTKSFAHLEYACAAYCGDPTHASESWSTANRQQTWDWMEAAYASALEFDVRWLIWFSSFDTATHLDNFDPNRWRYSKLADLMRRSTSVTVPVV